MRMFCLACQFLYIKLLFIFNYSWGFKNLKKLKFQDLKHNQRRLVKTESVGITKDLFSVWKFKTQAQALNRKHATTLNKFF